MTVFCQVLGFTLAAILASAQTPHQKVRPTKKELAALHEQVETYLQDHHIPGGLIAVASRGQVLHLEPFGMANVELSVAVQENSVFEIGSISKQFTSAAAMLLVEEGKLGLDDLIHHHLPHLPGDWLGVKVRHLLNHTSGIPDYEEIASYDIYGNRMMPEDVLKIAQGRPMDFEPGQAWHYSNTGYYIVSMIIERIEKKPLGQVLRSRIFEPLEMTQTRMADPEAVISNRASGYWVDKTGSLINRMPTETSSTLGAGGLLSTAGDLIKWDAALYENKLLSQASKAVLWTPTKLPGGKTIPYGFGWELSPYKGQNCLSHTGQVAGFLSSFDRFPDQELVFVLFLNLYDVSTEIKYPVFEAFLPAFDPKPETR